MGGIPTSLVQLGLVFSVILLCVGDSAWKQKEYSTIRGISHIDKHLISVNDEYCCRIKERTKNKKKKTKQTILRHEIKEHNHLQKND